MDFTKTVAKTRSALSTRELSKAVEGFHLERALATVGLERKPSSLSQVLPAIGLMAVSAAVGAAVALLLAPSSGRRLRTLLSDRLADAKHRLSDRVSHFEITPNHRHAVS